LIQVTAYINHLTEMLIYQYRNVSVILWQDYFRNKLNT